MSGSENYFFYSEPEQMQGSLPWLWGSLWAHSEGMVVLLVLGTLSSGRGKYKGKKNKKQ